MDAGKPCPQCGAGLELGHKSGLTTYQCPAAHGVGIDLLEAYRHLQRDELEAIWGGATDAPMSRLRSPLSGLPMVEVTFATDDDLELDNGGDGSKTMMTIEVDRENFFGWFSFDELRAMPTGNGPRPPRSEVVHMDHVEGHVDEYDEFFDNLAPEDYEPEEDWADDRASASGILSGLVRRLRS